MLTTAIAGPAGIAETASLVEASVDAKGVVYGLWQRQLDDPFEVESSVTATQPDGTTTLLMRSGDTVSGVPLGFVFTLAAAPLSGDLYLSDENDERLIRRTAEGVASTLADDNTSTIDGMPYRGARFIEVFANGTVAVGMYGSSGVSGVPVTVAMLSGDGPGAAWERSVASRTIQAVIGLAVTGAGASRVPDVYVIDAGLRKLHRIDGVTQEIETVLTHTFWTIDGLPVERIYDVVVDGPDLLMILANDNGEYLVRRTPDGTMTTIFGPDTPLGDEAQPGNFVRGLDLDLHGDLYVDSVDRVIRIPASGSCSTPRPDLVQVAASVNCDDQLDIIDALVIAQYDAAVRSERYSCPLAEPAQDINAATADLNGDGRVDVIDALTIAVCVAGGTNFACS